MSEASCAADMASSNKSLAIRIIRSDMLAPSAFSKKSLWKASGSATRSVIHMAKLLSRMAMSSEYV